MIETDILRIDINEFDLSTTLLPSLTQAIVSAPAYLPNNRTLVQRIKHIVPALYTESVISTELAPLGLKHFLFKNDFDRKHNEDFEHPDKKLIFDLKIMYDREVERSGVMDLECKVLLKHWHKKLTTVKGKQFYYMFAHFLYPAKLNQEFVDIEFYPAQLEYLQSLDNSIWNTKTLKLSDYQIFENKIQVFNNLVDRSETDLPYKSYKILYTPKIYLSGVAGENEWNKFLLIDSKAICKAYRLPSFINLINS